MSDVTGVILGWGGGGVASGQEVLSRISADHRERVRQALSAAQVYGAFDVSFRVPDRHGKSAWIDARGQAFGPQGEGYRRIIGVALDVTEERMAQARAQAAETRLRDAIESVSEAFVLLGPLGPPFDVQPQLPHLLQPGAAPAQARRRARDGRAGGQAVGQAPSRTPPTAARAIARPSSTTGAGCRSPNTAPPTAAA